MKKRKGPGHADTRFNKDLTDTNTGDGATNISALTPAAIDTA
jgi:hypothetical protein